MSDTTEIPYAEEYGGGSESLKAFRASLEAQGQRPQSAPVRRAAEPGPAADARTDLRKLVNGRARIVWGNGAAMVGKIHDLSPAGASILLDDMAPSKRPCTLECSVFHNGQHMNFSVPAVSVYCVLSGARFKAGFQFGARNPAVAKMISDILH